MNTGQKTKWWVDAALFTGFIVAFFLDLTGTELHQWIGVAAGSLAIYHLIAHWSWVSAVSQRFFGRTSSRARLYYLVDVVIFSGLAMILLTGVVISTWLNLSLTNYEGWLVVHITSSIITLLVMLLKLGLHWRWIATAAKNTFSQPSPTQSSPVPVRQEVGVKRVSRREFLGVIGVAGAASLFALTGATGGLKDLQGATETANTQNAANNSTTLNSTTTNSSTSSACFVECNRRCSYPGHCRRYTDGNSNGRCDFGECT
jgi:hypothetical protein